MSAEEWQAASKGRRMLERIYRSGFGQGLYYLIEMWWKKLILPTKKHVGVRRAIFWWDNLLVLQRRRGVDHGAGAVGRLRPVTRSPGRCSAASCCRSSPSTASWVS